MDKKDLNIYILFIYQVIFFLPFLATPVFSQLPKGKFLVDSVKIGEPIVYTLTFYHPKNFALFFPDKKYKYQPFELISKEYFPTKTNGTISIDSAVYILRTFELNPVILFSLPVSTINENGDTILLHSPPDTLFLDQLIDKASVDLPLKENTKFYPLRTRTNFPYYFFFIGILAFILLLIFLLFRKSILKRYKLYVMKQNHESFILQFEKVEKDFIQNRKLGIMEKALSLWKDYLSRLESSPINTYTTTEIISLFNNKDLIEGLQIIDRSIYRGMISQDSEKAFLVLKKFSNHRYQQIKKKIIIND